MAPSRRSLAWRAVSVSLILVGALAVAVSLWESPAAKIARQARRDHARALLEARQARGQVIHPLATVPPVVGTSSGAPLSRSVAAPTGSSWLPGQVAEVTIPALHVSAPVVAEGTSGATLDIPQDVHQVGWDEATSPAGAPGVTLLAGHVNWVGQGEGALGQIGQLVAGDPILLDWGGVRTVWRVVGPARLAPNSVIHPSLFRRGGSATLALVTCGGPFSETAQGGSYADNVIVLARLAG
jgi:hypothetical protein